MKKNTGMWEPLRNSKEDLNGSFQYTDLSMLFQPFGRSKAEYIGIELSKRNRDFLVIAEDQIGLLYRKCYAAPIP